MRNIAELGKLVDSFKKTEKIKSNLIFGKYYCHCDKTISLPIYGIGQYLHKTLENLNNIVDDKTQIIISNNSAKVEDDIQIQELCKDLNLKNVAYFQTDKSLGQLNNFNRCILLSKTDYVALIHDDDLLCNNFIDYYNSILKFLKKHKNIGMIHGKMSFFKDQPDIKKNQNFNIHKISSFMICHFGRSLTGGPTCGMIVNRKAVVESGGFNDEFPSNGDDFLSIQMMNLGYLIFDSDTLTGYYRIGDNLSLNLDICKGFIIEDHLFRQYWSNKNCFNKVYMHIFENYHYVSGIDVYVSAFSSFNNEITVKNLDFMHKYKKNLWYYLSGFFYKIVSKLIFKYISIVSLNINNAKC